jgi:hypothetical protein
VRAYNQARQANTTAQHFGEQYWHPLLIRPAGSVFARWLLATALAFAADSGEVILPYQGSCIHASVLADTLVARVRGVESAAVTAGDRPPEPSVF